MAIRKGVTIAVTSVKGGTGKTTTLLNLAGVYSLMKKRVLIMDFDFYGGGIATSLNVDNDNDIYKLVDDLTNNRFNNIEDYVSPYKELINVIPAPKDPRLANKINSRYLNVVISRASTLYDVILIDTNHILNEINLVTLDACDVIVYVINNDPLDLKNMKSIISIFKDLGKTNYKVVLNNSREKNKNYFNKYDIKNIIKTNIDYIIPDDFYIKSHDKYILDAEILSLNNKLRRKNNKTIKILELMATSLLKVNKGDNDEKIG